MAEILYFYGSLYAPQIVLVATLSAITIFRRQISCNHVYAEQGDDSPPGERRRQVSVTWNEKEAEEFLNGAGLYYSGSPLLSMVLKFCSVFDLSSSSSSAEGGGNSSNVSPLLKLNKNVSAGDLLELAGNYYCGEPVTSLLLRKPIRIPIARAIQVAGFRAGEENTANTEKSEVQNTDDMLGLPVDAWIHVMSFLKPKDIVNFSCTSRAFQKWVNEGETSNLLWKTLWRRDYAWVLQKWTVGQKAVARSGVGMKEEAEPPHFSKEVYFTFGLCYLDYVLAGCNTCDECLVGIGGHIYDMSLFLLNHPGSPETVMVHAGQDATDFFRRIGHSKGARRMAKSMCVVVDQTQFGGVGLGPTSYTRLNTNAVKPSTATSFVEPPDESAMTRYSSQSTLASAQTEFDVQQRAYQALALKRFTDSTFVTQPKVFYDPLVQRWKAWCMGNNLNTVFLDGID